MTKQPSSNEIKKKNWLIDILKFIASLKLTVICLLLLSLLVIWGTVYQAEHGLYQAQQKFFSSWFFLLLGVVPFPGTVLIMFVLFFNLLGAMFFRIGFKLSKLGNLIIHLGFIILLVGGFFTFYFSEESSIILKEKEGTELSSSRSEWEIAVWKGQNSEKDVYAYDIGKVKTGEIISFGDLGLSLKIKEYYKNCDAFSRNEGITTSDQVANSSGIHLLKEKPASSEVEENIPGSVLDIETSQTSIPAQSILLYGDDPHPTVLKLANSDYFFWLRRKKIPLPLHITLLDFRMKMYPNSNIPKSYESQVSIKAQGEESMEREVVISMNKPLRFKDYTFFQSSYSIEPDGTEYSILAVVKNTGRLLPYVSTFMVFLGLLIHFLGMLLKRRKVASDSVEKIK